MPQIIFHIVDFSNIRHKSIHKNKLISSLNNHCLSSGRCGFSSKVVAETIISFWNNHWLSFWTSLKLLVRFFANLTVFLAGFGWVVAAMSSSWDACVDWMEKLISFFDAISIYIFFPTFMISDLLWFSDDDKITLLYLTQSLIMWFCWPCCSIKYKYTIISHGKPTITIIHA